MAQSLTTTEGTLYRPGAYSSTKVQSTPSGLSTSGVLLLVGEADGGAHWSLEDDEALALGYGPDQGGDVRAKYLSGPLVDAYLAAVSAANDPDITGAPSKIVLVKTNSSAKASGTLPAFSGNYGTVADKGYGKKGNLIQFQTTENTAEVTPTTGSFTWLLNIAAATVTVRAKGGAILTPTLGALTTPTAFVSAMDGLTGIAATGGDLRVVVPVVIAGQFSLVATGNSIAITKSSTTWTTTPSIGDTLYIPTGSALQGAGNENRGSYVVTAATTTVVTATKLRNNAGTTPLVVTAPASVGATNIVAITDFQCYSPVAVSVDAADPVSGIGKTMELNEVADVNGDKASLYAYNLSTTAASIFGATTAPRQHVSGAEYAVTMTIARQFDGVSETFTVGGEIALKVGYTGTTGTITISDTALTTSRTGGSGADLDIDLKDYPTIADLATYINAQTGYSATVGSNLLGQLSPTVLDDVTAQGICTTFGNQSGRLKIDAYRFFNELQASVLLQLGTGDDPTLLVQAVSGLPDAMSAISFLSGGTKGGTTDATFQAAVNAMENVRGNFLVPLFSRDAAADVTAGLTDSTSTYTIAGINAYAKSHVLAMSVLKKRKNRQAFCSYKGTFLAAREAAAGAASYRANMTFQDVKNTKSTGGIFQFAPWMGAVLAAAMQAAGGYRPLVHKGINCSGVIQAAGDYNDQNDTDVENALKAGLLPAARVPIEDGGGVRWESDQTTYGRDSNFVYNSIQATYVSDLISLSTALRMERVFVGQSLADITATQAVSTFEAIMQDMMRLKFITRSDGSPKGWKDLVIRISGPSMFVSASIFLATGLYFIKIDFLVNQVTQTATG